ncbi:PepSY-associated TM helix domain-containing protein [Paraglaciecola aquimarina]|uniref:PepSY-associated TM helix domain-containing protein n=2 Tax=Paraglaciecola algarum TaxID=3050085 RepID=A0ABS9D4X2_9ALTE|nr:PepSY-associated TM helix domain-containing protein [Paraglaciecola sp. G1-23]
MSTALFSLLIFFSVTGITLNHLDWITSSKDPQLWQGELDNTVLEGFTPPATDSLLRWMENKHSLATASNIEWDQDAQEVLLDYPFPAGYAYVIVDVESGQYSIDYQNGSFWQIINDLHKGRHAGQSWAWLIDISAVFMVLFSITGLIILWQNRPKRQVGITLTLLGTGTPILIFFLLVPHLSGV